MLLIYFYIFTGTFQNVINLFLYFHRNVSECYLFLYFHRYVSKCYLFNFVFSQKRFNMLLIYFCIFTGTFQNFIYLFFLFSQVRFKILFIYFSYFHRYVSRSDSITISVWNQRKIHKKSGGFLGCCTIMSNHIGRLKNAGFQRLDLTRQNQDQEPVRGEKKIFEYLPKVCLLTFRIC